MGDTLGSFNSQEYNAPESEVFDMDTSTGVVEKHEGLAGETVELQPFEQVKLASKLFGIDINDPKENCKKCNGRGYTAIDSETRMPIGCECIFPADAVNYENIPDAPNAPAHLSRKERRAMQRKLNKQRIREAKKGRKR